MVVPTRKISHPRLDISVITYVQDIPKNVCNGIQEKIYTKTSYFSDRS